MSSPRFFILEFFSEWRVFVSENWANEWKKIALNQVQWKNWTIIELQYKQAYEIPNNLPFGGGFHCQLMIWSCKLEFCGSFINTLQTFPNTSHRRNRMSVCNWCFLGLSLSPLLSFAIRRSLRVLLLLLFSFSFYVIKVNNRNFFFRRCNSIALVWFCICRCMTLLPVYCYWCTFHMRCRSICAYFLYGVLRQYWSVSKLNILTSWYS